MSNGHDQSHWLLRRQLQSLIGEVLRPRPTNPQTVTPLAVFAYSSMGSKFM
jgi:hypothetical protein